MAKAHVYLAPGANVETTDTFASWIDTTNQLVYDMGTVVVSTVAQPQPNVAVGGYTAGNAHIEGIFSGTTLVAGSLRGGTVSTFADLPISTNTVFNGANNAFINNTVIGANNASTVRINSLVATSIIPTNNSIDLGTSANTYGALHTQDIFAYDDVVISGDLTVSGQVILSSNIQLSTNTSIIDNLTVGQTLTLGASARVVTDILPSANITYNLGSTALRWNNVWAQTFTGALSGNATTATTLQNTRTINGVSFNGSANITVTANTNQTLSIGAYLTGSNFNGSAATTWAVNANTGTVASTVVARDASGNFSANTITANLTAAAATVTSLTAPTVTSTGVITANVVNATSFSGPLTGNASTATTLQTARTINGVSFNGSANITITANTNSNLIPGAYITGSNFNGSTPITWDINATPNATAGTVVARDASGNIAVNAITGNGAGLTNLNASNIATGTIADARIPTNIVRDTRQVIAGSGLTGTGALSSDVTLTVDSTVIRTTGDQTLAGIKSFPALSFTGSATPNVNNTVNLGSSTLRFATVFATTFNGTATAATYADLAEKYLADAEYEIGTVIAVGGSAEVTAASNQNAHAVLGVVSEFPAYLMNQDLEGGTAIALKGRVPVKVQGFVNKGDRLVPSDVPGVAVVNNSRSAWSFAIALTGEIIDGKVEAIIL